MDTKKHIFIVSSCINIDSSPLAYFHKRSVFEPEERLHQTLFTLRAIREKINNCVIIVTNNNGLTNDQREIMKSHCDYIIEIDTDIKLDEYTFTINDLKTHPSKSFAETVSLYNACDKILELGLEFDYVWKISGRYYMLNSFNLANWPLRENVIVSPRTDDGVANNVIYSIPKTMITYYMNRLKQCAIKCFNDNNNNTYGVENSLFDFNNLI